MRLSAPCNIFTICATSVLTPPCLFAARLARSGDAQYGAMRRRTGLLKQGETGRRMLSWELPYATRRQGRRVNMDELWRYSEICRVANVKRPYMESLVAR